MMQVTKVWWDGEKLMAEPIDPASMYEDNEVAQPDSTCNNTLRAEGKGYPRTCRKCGKGPCINDRGQLEQRPPDAIPDAFNEWWNADYDDTGNPYRKDSPAYWAWSGWKAASKQPAQQEPAGWRPATFHRDNLTFNPGLPDEQTVKFWKLQGVEIEYCYTSPPAQRKPLTDEEISDLWCKVSNTDFVTADTHVFARAIEAAHGIKENT